MFQQQQEELTVMLVVLALLVLRMAAGGAGEPRLGGAGGERGVCQVVEVVVAEEVQA